MSTFTEFTNKVYNTVDNRNTRVLPYIKEATVRWLKELSQERMTLLEATFQFTLVADQQAYDSSTTGYPVDVIEFDDFWSKNLADGTSFKYPVNGPKPIAEVQISRTIPFLGNLKARRPLIFAFHDNRIWLNPIPADSTVVVGGEYLRDGTKDSTTGLPITVDSTTASNPWFTRGEHVLLNAVLYDLYLSILKDFQVASAFEKLFRDGLKTLSEEHAKRSGSGYQARGNLGDMNWF